MLLFFPFLSSSSQGHTLITFYWIQSQTTDWEMGILGPDKVLGEWSHPERRGANKWLSGRQGRVGRRPEDEGLWTLSCWRKVTVQWFHPGRQHGRICVSQMTAVCAKDGLGKDDSSVQRSGEAWGHHLRGPEETRNGFTEHWLQSDSFIPSAYVDEGLPHPLALGFYTIYESWGFSHN